MEAPKQAPSIEERLRPYAWAVLAVAMGLGVRQAFSPILPFCLPFITLFPAVFIAAYVGGLGPALLATLLSILGAVYFFLEPRFAFSLSGATTQIGVTLFALSGVMTGWLGESRLRAHRRVITSILRAESEAARAEEEAVRAEEEATRAEEETLRAEEEAARAEQEALRAARETQRVERILGSTTDGFMVLTPAWRISYMNERAAALVDGRPENYVGRELWEAFPDIVGGPLERAYRAAPWAR